MTSSSQCSIFSPSRKVKKDPNNVLEKEISEQSLYRTEMCRSFMERGICSFGASCAFAHSEKQLRPRISHPKFKTELCRSYHSRPFVCLYGSRCRFVHSENPLVKNRTRSSSKCESRAVIINGNDRPVIVVVPNSDEPLLERGRDSPRLPFFKTLTT
ncbi:hypothetical protein P9112_005632 [Eukaryota sp. TZLM1-RC]